MMSIMGRPTWKRALTALTFPLVVLLMLPLALSDALPMLAKAVAGRDAHVCQCKIVDGHSECACPVCHPECAGYELSEESIRGKCGSDGVTCGGKLGIALAPGAFVALTPRVQRRERIALRAIAPPQNFDSPPVPPPRNGSA